METLPCVGSSKGFLKKTSHSANNIKNWKVTLYEIKRLLHSDGDSHQNEEAAYRQGNPFTSMCWTDNSDLGIAQETKYSLSNPINLGLKMVCVWVGLFLYEVAN